MKTQKPKTKQFLHSVLQNLFFWIDQGDWKGKLYITFILSSHTQTHKHTHMCVCVWKTHVWHILEFPISTRTHKHTYTHIRTTYMYWHMYIYPTSLLWGGFKTRSIFKWSTAGSEIRIFVLHLSIIRESLCICVCVCVCERERVSERESMWWESYVPYNDADPWHIYRSLS